MKAKIIIFLCFFLLSYNSEAYDPYDLSATEKQVTPQVPLPVYKGESENRSKLEAETSAITLKFGKTIARFPEPMGVTMNAVSYRRFSDEFFYGLEVNSFYSEPFESRATDIQFILGKRFLWSYRFLPYISFQAGSADFKRTQPGFEDSATGLAATLDGGLEFLKIKNLKFGTGMRYTHMTFDSKTMSEASFLDLYLSTGIEF